MLSKRYAIVDTFLEFCHLVSSTFFLFSILFVQHFDVLSFEIVLQHSVRTQKYCVKSKELKGIQLKGIQLIKEDFKC